MKKYNVKSIYASYDVDITTTIIDITIKSGRKTHTDCFYVQLCGGEYNSPMGCWITTDSSDGDLDFDSYQNGAFKDAAGAIITAAEQSYHDYCQEQINDNEEDEADEVWTKVDSIQHSLISATSSTELRVEQSNLGRFRTYTDNSGFTQPTDYSMLPNFEMVYFEDESRFAAHYVEEN